MPPFETIRVHVALLRNFAYDYVRYRKHSFATGGRGREHRKAIIRIFAHYLEGGMCFPEARLGYGQDKGRSLCLKLRSYIGDFGIDDTVRWAVATLRAYLDYHRAKNMPLPEIEELLASLPVPEDGEARGGCETVTCEDIKAATAFDFRRFLLTRHSVRQFAPGALDEETIRRVVANAQESPNVCNRQTCRVYALTDPASIGTALDYQLGNAGFRQEISTLFIVTSNMSHLNLVGERFQGWIDGGIFGMTLALSIHAEGLGACFLNWSVEAQRDRAMRDAVGIPDSELVITMMAAGHMKESFEVPVSARKSLDEVLVLNPPVRRRGALG